MQYEIKIKNIIPIKVYHHKEKQLSFQDWIKIRKIEGGLITMQDQSKVTVLKVLPINFRLKSQLEQKSILYEYQNFLKNINSKTQILISSKKTDVSNHIKTISKITKENPQLTEMSNDYIYLINRIISDKKTITKDFYIVINHGSNASNEISKIIEYLSNCGNEVNVCEKGQIISLIRNFTNKRIETMI